MSGWPMEVMERMRVLWKDDHSTTQVARILVTEFRHSHPCIFAMAGKPITRNSVIGQIYRARYKPEFKDWYAERATVTRDACGNRVKKWKPALRSRSQAASDYHARRRAAKGHNVSKVSKWGTSTAPPADKVNGEDLTQYRSTFECDGVHTPKSLFELKANDCRWPICDGFCGNAKFGHKSYCAHHARLSVRRVYAPRSVA